MGVSADSPLWRRHLHVSLQGKRCRQALFLEAGLAWGA